MKILGRADRFRQFAWLRRSRLSSKGPWPIPEPKARVRVSILPQFRLS
jgi:hypothetical protein